MAIPVTIIRPRHTQASPYTSVKPAFDIYNLFNASTILRVNNTHNARWPQPTDVLAGRLFKFGADIDF